MWDKLAWMGGCPPKNITAKQLHSTETHETNLLPKRKMKGMNKNDAGGSSEDVWPARCFFCGSVLANPGKRQRTHEILVLCGSDFSVKRSNEEGVRAAVYTGVLFLILPLTGSKN